MLSLGTLTGVHQGAHISLAKFWLDGNVRSWSIRMKSIVLAVSICICCRDFFLLVGSATQVSISINSKC